MMKLWIKIKTIPKVFYLFNKILMFGVPVLIQYYHAKYRDTMLY